MPVDADTHQVGLVDLQGRLRSLVTQLDEAPSGLALDIYTASPSSLNMAGNDGAVHSCTLYTFYNFIFWHCKHTLKFLGLTCLIALLVNMPSKNTND